MIIHGDCLHVLKTFADNSIDSIVTDPPYGIKFMGKKWDHEVPQVEIWKECLRVLKPGGHMLVACGTRTQHRMVVNVEDAGFEIRDVITWLYGSGFPKSHNISKSIDKEAGVERKVIKDMSKKRSQTNLGLLYPDRTCPDVTEDATEDAKKWSGWGTALKPACEFWTLCRKPLSEETIAKNILAWGTGGINIDKCRVQLQNGEVTHGSGKSQSNNNATGFGDFGEKRVGFSNIMSTQVRWPANLILDEEAAAAIDDKSGISVSKSGGKFGLDPGIWARKKQTDRGGHNDSGGSSRFFYCAKASPRDRGPDNNHPTVKPNSLMGYLIKLTTPPNGTVLDPFAGSGSTCLAAKDEGFKYIGIERESEFVEIIKKRLGLTDPLDLF
jgi:DNA modification methylase